VIVPRWRGRPANPIHQRYRSRLPAIQSIHINHDRLGSGWTRSTNASSNNAGCKLMKGREERTSMLTPYFHVNRFVSTVCLSPPKPSSSFVTTWLIRVWTVMSDWVSSRMLDLRSACQPKVTKKSPKRHKISTRIPVWFYGDAFPMRVLYGGGARKNRAFSSAFGCSGTANVETRWKIILKLSYRLHQNHLHSLHKMRNGSHYLVFELMFDNFSNPKES